MRAQEFIAERKVASIRGQIQDAVRQHGGDPRDYFVRFTEVDKIGFSDRQKFKRHVEIDDPSFTVSSIGTSSRGGGRRALWFYPLRTYLGMMSQGEYAMDFPYVWLVKKRPDAWLQPIGHRDPREVKAAPKGQRRVGILKGGLTPQAVFFEPAFDVVGRYYDYAGQHRRHGEVRGAPKPTFFDRVRGTLNEIGDRPSEYEPNRRRRRSLFHATVDDQWVDVFFDRSPINDSLQITFTVNQNYEAPPRPTRASGSVIRILSTVLNIVREQLPQYMKSARPPRVTFTAKGASRIELYKRYFVPVIQDILGDQWQLEITPGNMTVFVWEPKR